MAGTVVVPVRTHEVVKLLRPMDRPEASCSPAAFATPGTVISLHFVLEHSERAACVGGSVGVHVGGDGHGPRLEVGALGLKHSTVLTEV